MSPPWVNALGRHSRGSRPRCVALVDGTRAAVSESLTKLISLPDVTVDATDFWMPQGKPVKRTAGWDVGPCREARIERDVGFLSKANGDLLKTWWLSVREGANTPNWDLAATCTILGHQGLLLVEAKAHGNELSTAGKALRGTSNGWKNHERIAQAIDEARAGLNVATQSEWSLSPDSHYQLANRFAWAWKVAELGIPVVLIYLGFLNSRDMAGDGPLFLSHQDWDATVREHAANTVPDECWDKPIRINDVQLYPLIRSTKHAF